jgi:hypothetical protein
MLCMLCGIVLLMLIRIRLYCLLDQWKEAQLKLDSDATDVEDKAFYSWPGHAAHHKVYDPISWATSSSSYTAQPPLTLMQQ